MVEHYNLYSDDSLDTMIKDDCCYAIQVDKLQDRYFHFTLICICSINKNLQVELESLVCNTRNLYVPKLGIGLFFYVNTCHVSIVICAKLLNKRMKR